MIIVVEEKRNDDRENKKGISNNSRLSVECIYGQQQKKHSILVTNEKLS
jgi:hypothetical protein